MFVAQEEIIIKEKERHNGNSDNKSRQFERNTKKNYQNTSYDNTNKRDGEFPQKFLKHSAPPMFM